MNASLNNQEIIIELSNIADVQKELNELKKHFIHIHDELTKFTIFNSYHKLTDIERSYIVECLNVCHKEIEQVKYKFNFTN